MLRQPAHAEDVCSEALVAQGGAWILQFEGFTDPDERAMPFAAILDTLPSVAIVPELVSWDEPSKSLREYVWGYAQAAGLRVEMNNRALMDLGDWTRARSPGDWYATLRGRWMPTAPRLLIVMDRVPDPRGPRHHFYADPVTAGDELFRTVVQAVYDQTPGRPGSSKSGWLEKLRNDQIWTLDIVREPTLLRNEFEEELMKAVPAFLNEVAELGPQGVVLCGERTFSVLFDAGLPLLHHEPVASPTSSRGRRHLAEVVRRALGPDG